MIYLDAAATTPLDPRALRDMMPYLTSEYGNPGMLYQLGRTTAQAVDKARKQVAEFINASPEQIVFTSGGSEANNLALRGVCDYLKSQGRTHILISAVEHDSVLRAAQALAKDGFDVEYLPVSSDCVVSAAAVEATIKPQTGLVSVMYVNNETGAVDPIEDIGAICMKRGVLFHTDCVQAAGCHLIDVVKIGCDLLSISSHKICGPKGVGALYVKDRAKLSPIISGGPEQEFGLRGGTENVPGIVGFGKACEISTASLHEDCIWVSTLKQRFFTALNDALSANGEDGILHVNGPSPVTPGKTLNIRIDGVDGQTLLLMLDGLGVYLSAGSACCSHEIEPSHILTAMGLTKEQARSSIRVSFYRMNTAEEVVKAAGDIAESVRLLKMRTGE